MMIADSCRRTGDRSVSRKWQRRKIEQSLSGLVHVSSHAFHRQSNEETGVSDNHHNEPAGQRGNTAANTEQNRCLLPAGFEPMLEIRSSPMEIRAQRTATTNLPTERFPSHSSLPSLLERDSHLSVNIHEPLALHHERSSLGDSHLSADARPSASE